MTISFEQVNKDLKEALKKQDKARISVLRMLISEIHNLEIQKKSAASPQDVISVLEKSVKRHQDSIAQFANGGREDLVAREKAELQILESYLPEPLSLEELSSLIQEAVSQSRALSPQDFGKVMKLLMPQIKGRALGAKVSELVKEALTKT